MYLETPDNQKLLPGRSQTRLIARMWCGRTDRANTSRTAMSRRTTFLRIVSTRCDVTRKRKEVLAELPRLSTYTPSPEAEVGSMAAAADPDDEEGWVKVEVMTLLIVAAPGCAGSRGVARLPEIVWGNVARDSVVVVVVVVIVVRVVSLSVPPPLPSTQ